MAENYQGWTNEATWAVALSIDNDYPSHKLALRLTMDRKSVLGLSKSLKHTFGIMKGSSTNWVEIAEHYIRKVNEGVT